MGDAARVDRDADAEVVRRPPLRAKRRRAAELPEYLPARMVNEYVYCPRLFFYEWVEGLFAHSVDTVEGALRHEKLERKQDALPAAPPQDENAERETLHSRSVELSSDTHKLIARIDLIEGEGNRAIPVEYKKGAPRPGDEGPEAWPADEAQVCVQALVLRDNRYQCDEAVLYYSATKQRVRVPITDELVAATLVAIGAARATAVAGDIPPPLIDSPKCPRCSLVGICLPDETTMAMALTAPPADGQLPLFEAPDAMPLEASAADSETLRRLVPARDDLRPLYVTGYGLSIGKSGEVLQIRQKGKLIQEARLCDISQVNVFGTVQLTSAVMQGLCWSEKPLAHFSMGGWFYGLTQGLALKNIFLRRDQFRRADDEEFCLHVARCLTAAKIRNQRTLLQRNHVEPPGHAIKLMKRCADRAATAQCLEELLGIEGTAARLYFENFAGMLKAEDEPPAFNFDKRNRRPPRDPVNAMLSFGYSLLAKDLTIVCHSIGFDPFLGFYHQPRFGRPALALDLMESFRPLVVDSAVLSAVNTRMVGPNDFLRAGDAMAMTPSGRKAFIRAYEQRVDALVTHPMFGYRVSYRRVFEIQARLLARFITGEISTYQDFETR